MVNNRRGERSTESENLTCTRKGEPRILKAAK